MNSAMEPSFPRLLAPEILDELGEDDPRAVQSRKDLQRINFIMGSAGILGGALARASHAPARIVELGAGDGSLMLRLARRLAPHWRGVHVVLLDRQRCVTEETREAIRRTGWTLQVRRADVTDWIAESEGEHFDIAIANLFIHHFDPDQIARLFEALGRRTDRFIACEPWRARLPLLASRMVGLLGANDVTRADAVASVKAGFQADELSSLWPYPSWKLEERRAGLFSHLFVARRA